MQSRENSPNTPPAEWPRVRRTLLGSLELLRDEYGVTDEVLEALAWVRQYVPSPAQVVDVTQDLS